MIGIPKFRKIENHKPAHNQQLDKGDNEKENKDDGNSDIKFTKTRFIFSGFNVNS